MKINNNFFKKKNYLKLSLICRVLSVKKSVKDLNINSIIDLENAKKNDISFFNSLKYEYLLKKTKAKFVISEKKYENLVAKYCNPLIVDNTFKSVAIITKLFYPNSLNDTIDFDLKTPSAKNYKNVKFGQNILIGKNVKIGKSTYIGHNTLIESNVKIGNNCIIGNNVILKNCKIGNSVRILDGAIVGKTGFGFFPDNIKNERYPHIGIVIIEDNVEVGCNNTIDRGSMSNTIIGKNTFLDNQVHIAHNVKIGKNCIITGQVGFAGSSIIGNNVQIGGQAGISGHLKVGNNVSIGGGSGVLKNIPDNSKVIGYPATDIKNFLKRDK